MAKLVIYLALLIIHCASAISGMSSIVQPEESKPGKDYSHFMYKREAHPEPHGGGGHGGGFGGGHVGGFGGGHGGGYGGYGGGYGIGHYGGGFGGGPIMGIGFGGFIPVPVYRPYGYGYGRYRRSLNAPQAPPNLSPASQNVDGDKVQPDLVTNPRNNTTNTSLLHNQQERQKIEWKTDSEEIITSNTPILINQQVQRERSERSADASADEDRRDRYSNLDYDGYGNYRYRYGNGERKRYLGFNGGVGALVLPIGDAGAARPGYDYAGY